MGNSGQISVSIAPTYLCNMDCSFCYLSKEERSNKAYTQLEEIDKKLMELSYHRKIDHIDLYGGEIALLPEEYLDELFNIFRWHKNHDASINVITNFLKLNPALMRNDDVELSISYDFDGRERSEQVFMNMIQSEKDFSVLMLGSKEMLETPINKVVSAFNFLKRLKSVEIKPYSSNQHNKHFVPDEEFEDFVKKLYSHPKRNFEFTNEMWAKDCLKGEYSAYSDNHLYITPEADYAVLDFDENDNEYFKKLDSFEDYEKWCEEEKKKVQSLPQCFKCEYLGKCMTEHYKTACSGYPDLLDFFKTEAQ